MDFSKYKDGISFYLRKWLPIQTNAKNITNKENSELSYNFRYHSHILSRYNLSTSGWNLLLTAKLRLADLISTEDTDCKLETQS